MTKKEKLIKLKELINENMKMAQDAKSNDLMADYHFLKGRAHGINESINALLLLDSNKTDGVREKIIAGEFITDTDII